MEYINDNNLINVFAKNILDIDLELFSEDELVYKKGKEILSQILKGYSIETEQFLPSFIKCLSEMTGIGWEAQITKQNYDEKYWDYDEVRPVGSMFGDMPTLSSRKGNKTTISLVSDLLSAKIVYAESKDGYCPDKVLNETLFNKIEFENLLQTDFPPFVDEILYESFSDWITNYKSEIKAKFIEELNQHITELYSKRKELNIQKRDYEYYIEKMRKRITRLRPIDRKKFEHQHRMLNLDPKYLKYKKYPSNKYMEFLVSCYARGSTNEEIYGLLDDINYENGESVPVWTCWGSWEAFRDLAPVTIVISEEVPRELLNLLNLYSKTLEKLSFRYSNDKIREYSVNRWGDFYREQSGQLSAFLNDEKNPGEGKEISLEQCLQNFNQLKLLIEKVRKLDLTSPNHKNYKETFWQRFLEEFGSEYGCCHDRMMKEIDDNAFIEGEDSNWKEEMVLKCCLGIEKKLSSAEEIIRSYFKNQKQSEVFNTRFCFYHRFYSKYSKQLELEDRVDKANRKIRDLNAKEECLEKSIFVLSQGTGILSNDSLNDEVSPKKMVSKQLIEALKLVKVKK